MMVLLRVFLVQLQLLFSMLPEGRSLINCMNRERKRHSLPESANVLQIMTKTSLHKWSTSLDKSRMADLFKLTQLMKVKLINQAQKYDNLKIPNLILKLKPRVVFSLACDDVKAIMF